MNFLKTFLASILGTIIGVSLLIFILFISILSTSGEPEPYIRANSVLTVELTGTLPAKVDPDPFEELFPGRTGPRISLQMLKSNLEKAATDENISGVWLKVNRLSSSWANLETAYQYLKDYKESGKFLYVSTDDLGMNETSYFLATLADSIYSPPETWFEFNGFVMQSSYYKNLLEKIGVEPEIIRVGKYKSAVEPFLREESSPEHREQVTAILDAAAETFKQAVREKSGLSFQQIDSLMNDIPADPVQRAHQYGLIDVVAFPAEIEQQIKNRIGLDDDDDLRTVDIKRYNRVTAKSAGLDLPDTSDRIAVLYAEGAILPDAVSNPFSNPFDGEPVITPSKIKKSLDEIRNNDNITALVFHINSPGGSATTSDMIWHYLREASEDLPIVAYMGNVAASGGYYIAMGADTVVASPNTITGSIGIYNMMFNTQELYNDKLGISFDEFKTHDHADIFNMTRPLTPSEREAIARNVENGYETFLQRVAENRNKTRDQVHELAQGRVWTGTDALQNGLVDVNGSLDRALSIAAEMAEIEDYRTVTYPERKDFYEILFGSANAKMQQWVNSFVPFSNEVHSVEQLMNHNAGRNWTLLPIEFTIE